MRVATLWHIDVRLPDWPGAWYIDTGDEMEMVNAYTTDEIERGILHDPIQVAGLRWFEEDHWREAILYFLFGVWGDRREVTYRPKIHFGEFVLRLDLDEGLYQVEKGRDLSDALLLEVRRQRMLSTTVQRAEFEVALVSFVKNDAVRVLRIVTMEQYGFYLWKGVHRGQLYHGRAEF